MEPRSSLSEAEVLPHAWSENADGVVSRRPSGEVFVRLEASSLDIKEDGSIWVRRAATRSPPPHPFPYPKTHTHLIRSPPQSAPTLTLLLYDHRTPT